MSKPANIAQKILGPATARTISTRDTVSLAIDSDSIAWIVFNDTRKSANVIDIQFVDDLHKVLDEVDQLADEGKVRIVVLYSAKPTFILGADIHMIYPVTDASLAREASATSQRLFNRIAAFKVPTIAGINGTCMGGGYEICLACTYRVAAATKNIQIGLPEVKLGLLPGAGGTVRLPKIIGLQNALQIILPGGSANPAKAKKLGMVDKIFEAEDRFPGEHRFFYAVRQFATTMIDRPTKRRFGAKTFTDKFLNETAIGRYIVAKMAVQNLDKTTKGKYPAPYKALQSVLNSCETTPSNALEFEAEAFGNLVATAESKNLISIFFMTEEAKKVGNKTNNARPIDVQKLGVIGAGVMGSGIAQIFAYKNVPVYMKDIKQEFVDNGLKTVGKLFQGLVARRRLTKEEGAAKTRLVTGGVEYQGLADCQVVVEAAIERMDLKQKILIDCEKTMAPNAIFATNTSSLSIDELASVSSRPQNVVGMHFFNPVHRMPLVEIIKGKHTSDEAVATIYKLTLKLGKIPVIVGDGPGFLVNRILGIYMAEAGRLAAEGADIVQIDRAILDFGMPMGPFRLIDEVGLDVASHVAPILSRGLGPRFESTGAPIFEHMTKQGMLGKKSGRGFYKYENGKSVGVDPAVFSLVYNNSKSRKRLTTEEIVDRCILLMVNEAAYILAEKLVATPEDIDLGMIMGTGFAPFRGGLLSYADSRSVHSVVIRLQELQAKLGDRFTPAPLLVEMAQKGQKFFPKKPSIPFIERRKPARPRL